MRGKLTRSGSIATFAVVVTAGALLPGTGALARTNAKAQFYGTCQVQGDQTTTDVATGAFKFVGDGTCVGQLNGKAVVGAPFHITEKGTVTVLGALPVPITGSGSGLATITDPASRHKYHVRYTAQQVGTVITATCHGGGNAVAAFVPTGPPSATANHLAGVLQTLTPCQS
jgi:hypothetical protein